MTCNLRTGGALIGLSGLMLVGCESGSMSALDLGVQSDTRFDYLVARYDTDGDQMISIEEYDREGDRFERLDRNEDGILSEEDFASAGGGMQARMAGMQAQRAVGAYFQDDDVNDRMTKTELVRGIAAYDTNRDGAISAEEFETTSGDRKVELPGDDSPMMRRMLQDGDPYEMIVKQTDSDEDGVLGNDELVAYFDDNANDGVWIIRSPMGGRRRPGGTAANGEEDYVEPTDGAMMGQMAPDFSLQPPDGGEVVTLSSLRGNLPVALIFGSYT